MRKRLALILALALIVLSSAGIAGFISAQESPKDRAVVRAGGGGPLPSAGIRAVAPDARLAQAATKHVDGRDQPPETLFFPDRVYRGNGSTLYRVSRESGVLCSVDAGKSWEERNTGLPTRLVYPFERKTPPLVTSFAIDPRDDSRIALTLPDAVFVSGDGGQAWGKVPVKEPIKPNDQLTTVALGSADHSALLVGTSFHGFFETLDGGKTWTNLAEKNALLYMGGGSYEEVASLAYHPADPSVIYFVVGFGKGLYALHKGTRSPKSIEFPGDQAHAPIRDIAFRGGGQKPWLIEVRTTEARWLFDPSAAEGGWNLVEMIGGTEPLDPEKKERTAKAEGKYGIYVSSVHANGKTLDEHIAFCLKNGLNSMVVDFKDDFGFLTYDTALEMPIRIGAVRQRFNASEIVEKAHAAGLYLIGRIVVFRDKELYNADGYAFAVWDRAAKGPWRYMKKTVDPATGEESFQQGEYWVDPYSEDVWRYNVDIGREIESRGVDEVQFDYIRFPSDGDLSRIHFRHRKEGMGKVEALESFLAMAREAIRIPISTDVYGYCGWARISGWVAQSIEVFSRYVDVISPMYYPSHFPRDFLGSMAYMPRAQYLYKEGPDRATMIVEGRSIIRPYVQAFRIGGELSFNKSVYSNYLVNQVQGALQSAASGFTLWNASNDYYMVTAPLFPLITQDEQASRDAPAPR